MAIYHLSVKPVSRKAGRSATASAAYRAADLVHDHTSGETFDYTRKRGVEHAEIVLPTSAAKQDINWARDREQLWNAAERAENRSNSRVAREYEVALPNELNKAQRLALTREFAAEIANRHGVAVDLAIHAPHWRGDQRNWHAHLFATTREITPTGLGEKVSIEWSDTNRRKAELEPARKEIESIRERWATLTNEKLHEQGLEIRVDHRSLKAQGIEREPTSHLGVAVSGMERRGIETEVGKRIGLEAASWKLEQAAELGRIEREASQVRQQALDLSGDLAAARQERDRSRAPEHVAREEIEAGKAQFRAGFEQYKVDQAERQRQLERGRERYQKQQQTEQAQKLAAEQQRQKSLDLERQKARDWGLDREGPGLDRGKDRDYGMER